ncbi:PorP/SprF family type IX secretion system membrane protein [Catalinimonas niigatensis]|uniref:PorP/SprF family type IX secretion system membrane protein n=1 Tax=Catalinimonas niigatensis TaxID=1397264 RepID=UPI002664E655|nr:PorP/SprF family type IX secretion system membrane protein [Catalinimonas niigatensis]WPP51153.1 PorP/SprF family type IX secretion system membrane protein [Catalinimonas niigatensis]
MRNLLLFIFFLVTRISFAQHPVLSHYPVNPSLFNPAFAGYKGLSEILLNHRQQWIGINGAPTVSTFQLSIPFGTRIGAGIRAQRFTRGAINTNTFNGIFAYKVPFGRNTVLTFGLAGGITSTGLNSNSSYNIADPVVAAFSENQIHPDLKFGANYHLRNFNLGITFTEMIFSDIYRTKLADQTDVKFYENYIVNFDYKFKIPASKFSLQPFVLYTEDEYSNPYFEAGSLVKYQEIIYMGGSYRQDYGMSVLTGIQIKKLAIGYGYELASRMVNAIGQGTHEVQLSYRFYKSSTVQTKASQQEQHQIAEDVEEVQDELVKEPLDTQEKRDEEFTRLEEIPAHTIYHRGDSQNELPVGFYVIAGAYKTQENARKRTTELSKERLFAANAYNSESQLFYVYVYRTNSLKKTMVARDEYRKKASLEDAWLLEIKDKR